MTGQTILSQQILLTHMREIIGCLVQGKKTSRSKPHTPLSY